MVVSANHIFCNWLDENVPGQSEGFERMGLMMPERSGEETGVRSGGWTKFFRRSHVCGDEPGILPIFLPGSPSRDLVLPFERFGMRNWELMIGIYFVMMIIPWFLRANGFSHFESSD
jgi:hypothetical protein